MTATLTFNLPEEAEDHLTCLNGWKYKSCLVSLDENLRDKLKYGHKFIAPDEVLEFARKAIHDLAAQDNLSLD